MEYPPNITRKSIDNQGMAVSFLDAGEGPAIVFCHGFPGLSHSWIHQIKALSTQGFRVIAPDMRGYGDSGKPDAIDAYSLDHIRSDMLALLDQLDIEKAVFVGHDFGAPVVWNLALENPERVSKLIVISVPYDFDYYGRRGQGHFGDEALDMPPSEQFAAYAENNFLHAHYFQEPGIAEQELEANTEAFFKRIYWTLSGEGDLISAFSQAKPGSKYLEVLPEPAKALPWDWITEESLSVYIKAYEMGGFTGPLNWYRVADINWRLNKKYLGRKISTPTCFIAGEQDPVISMSGPEAIETMKKLVPGLQYIHLIPHAGHWVQQEQADKVNELIKSFCLETISL